MLKPMLADRVCLNQHLSIGADGFPMAKKQAIQLTRTRHVGRAKLSEGVVMWDREVTPDICVAIDSTRERSAIIAYLLATCTYIHVLRKIIST